MSYFYGSICLSDIPEDMIVRKKRKDGVEKSYVKVFIGKRRRPFVIADTPYTHYVACARKRDDGAGGKLDFIGTLAYFPHGGSDFVDNSQPCDDVIEDADSSYDLWVADQLPF